MRPKMTKIPSIRLKKRNGGYFCYFGLQKGDIAKMREVGGGKCCILWLIYLVILSSFLMCYSYAVMLPKFIKLQKPTNIIFMAI
jgi:hypothetical protein